MANYLAYLAEIGGLNLHPLGEEATAVLLSHLPLRPGTRVLEIGCGTAVTLAQVAQTDGVQVVGLEPLPAMLTMAQKRLCWLGLGTVPVLQGSGTQLPLANGLFDAVYMESVLGFQAEKPARQMLAEIARVLKPGGVLVANEAVWRPGVTAVHSQTIYDACQQDFGICQASPQPWGSSEWLAEMTAAGLTASAIPLTPNTPLSFPLFALRSSLSTIHYSLFTWLHQAKVAFSPRLLAQRWHYRTLLRRHAHDGEHIECFLFIAHKA